MLAIAKDQAKGAEQSDLQLIKQSNYYLPNIPSVAEDLL